MRPVSELAVPVPAPAIHAIRGGGAARVQHADGDRGQRRVEGRRVEARLADATGGCGEGEHERRWTATHGHPENSIARAARCYPGPLLDGARSGVHTRGVNPY